MSSQPLTRRDFLRISAISGIAATTTPTLLSGCGSSSTQYPPLASSADTVFRNGTVYLDTTTTTDTIAVANGKVIATGIFAATVNSSTTIVDLAGGAA